MEDLIRRLNGANMDIDLATPENTISWQQDQCPWNKDDKNDSHKCAVKNISICRYFCGIEYLDTLICCYPHPNPFKSK